MVTEHGRIEVYYDYLIYFNHKKEIEVDFYKVHHIDVDIQENAKQKLYVKELTLLDEAESEMLCIEGECYEKEELDFLIHRILEIQSLLINNGR